MDHLGFSKKKLRGPRILVILLHRSGEVIVTVNLHIFLNIKAVMQYFTKSVVKPLKIM
jgi:hypothetical protein